MNESLLEVNNLNVTLRRGRQSIPVLDDVSFRLGEGETLGIVGESGCGKSTLGLSIMGMGPSGDFDIEGRVLFRGEDVLSMNDGELRRYRGRDAAMILQDPMTSLNPVFTVGNQVAETLLTHRLARRGRLKEEVLSILRNVKIPEAEHRVNAYPHQLSGGMRQRVVGAIAISCRPKLLIADEPTTALDVTIQMQYLQLLKDLQRQLNMALVFITHDFGAVARMCDRVCVMYAGQVVESAGVRDIFRTPEHWYTTSLIRSVPSLDARPERLASIPGSPPALDEAPAGCRFAPRCSNAGDRCRKEVPPMLDHGTGHAVRCWFPRAAAENTGAGEGA